MGIFSTKTSEGLVSKIGRKIAHALSNKKRTAAVAAIAVGATGLSAIPASAQINLDPDSMRCAAVHVVYANGTGGSGSDRSTHISQAASEGKQLYDATVAAVGADNVSAFVVPYPASIGSLSPFTTAFARHLKLPVAGLGTEVYSYGESVSRGVKTGQDHIRDYMAACPNSRIIIGGFSQGASVAGDIAAGVAHGNVSGVTADEIAGVVLYSDPYRAAVSASQSSAGVAQSRLYANSPQGTLGNNLETIIGYQGGNASYVGLAGPRPLNFQDLQGKVMSLCHPVDPACAVPEGGMLRGVADFANNGGFAGSNMGDTQTFDRVLHFLDLLVQSGAAHAASVGNFEAASQKAVGAFNQANFQLVDLFALINSLGEIGKIVEIGIDAYGDEMSLLQFVGALAVSAIPPLVESHSTPEKLIPLARDVVNQVSFVGLAKPEWIAMAHAAIVVADGAIKALDAGIGLLNRGLSFVGAKIPNASESIAWVINEGTNFIVNGLADITGISKFMEGEAFQRLAAEAHQLGGGPSHGAYFNPGYDSGNGVPTQTLVHNWVGDVSRGVINNADVTPEIDPAPEAPAPGDQVSEAPAEDVIPVDAPAEANSSAEANAPAEADSPVEQEAPAEPELVISEEPVEALSVTAIPGPANVQIANTPLSIANEVVLDVSEAIASLPSEITQALAPEGWNIELDSVNGLLRVQAPEGQLLNGIITLNAVAGAEPLSSAGLAGADGAPVKGATAGLHDLIAAHTGISFLETSAEPENAVKIVVSQNASGAPTTAWSEDGTIASAASDQTVYHVVSNSGEEKGVNLSETGEVVATEEYLASAPAGDETTISLVATEPSGERAGSILHVVADGNGGIAVMALETTAIARAASFQTQKLVVPEPETVAEQPADDSAEADVVAAAEPEAHSSAAAPEQPAEEDAKGSDATADEGSTSYTAAFSAEGIVDDQAILAQAESGPVVDTTPLATGITDEAGVAKFIEHGTQIAASQTGNPIPPAPKVAAGTDAGVDTSAPKADVSANKVDAGQPSTVEGDVNGSVPGMASDFGVDDAAGSLFDSSAGGSSVTSGGLSSYGAGAGGFDWAPTTSASDFQPNMLAWTGSTTLPLAGVSLLFLVLGIAALRRQGVIQSRES